MVVKMVSDVIRGLMVRGATLHNDTMCLDYTLPSHKYLPKQVYISIDL